MNRETILPLIYEWQNIIQTKKGVERAIEPDILITAGSKPIKIITGFRRSGKSFLVQQLARKLIDRGIFKIDELLYLNFEDYRLAEVTSPDSLGQIFELFRQVSASPAKKLIIFDEIQKVKNWDKFVRTLYEKEQVEIILTGSNSELLSAELGSNLAGRFIEFFLLPFSFQEFLAYKGIAVSSPEDYYRRHDEIKMLFTEYLTYGGLPEVFDILSGDARLSYLSGVLNKVVLDDVIKRFKVENIDAIEKLLHYLLAGCGNVVSYASLSARLQAIAMKIKAETVIAYCGYFLKTFALFELNKFSWKQSRIFGTAKKYYAVDNGLLSLYRPVAENFSFRLENLVLVELKRRYREICYGVSDSGWEIDFLARNDERSWDKYQVSVSLTAENEKREMSPFAASHRFLKTGGNYLLTMDEQEGDLAYKGVAVKKMNLIRWFLNL